MKFGKRLMSMALALVMIFGLTVNASAAASQNVTAKLSPDITVKLGNATQAMVDANGAPVYPVLYNGTTYLPVRAIGDMLGLDVAWVPFNRTVMLAGFAAHTNLKNTSDEANSGAASGAKPVNITARIDPGVIVEYNGKAQKMTDASGSPVYPMLYNGTTYLPVRAVSDMLDVDVTWNQDTRTVTLVKSTGMTSYQWEFGVYNYFDFGNGVKARTQSDEITVTYRGGKTETFGFNNVSDLRAALEKADCSESLIDKAVEIFVSDHNQILANTPKPVSPFKDIQTSNGNRIETINDTCIACTWGKLDWSTADDGYVTVTVNELAGSNTRIQVHVSWANDYNFSVSDRSEYLAQGEWLIPLRNGSAEYVVRLSYASLACEHMRTEAEQAEMNDYHRASSLVAKFNAEINNPEAVWTMSTPRADFEKAPKTQAKAKELTKNCKSDTEKVTAIFNWITNNIKYDHALANSIQACENAANSTCSLDNPNGRHTTLAPSDALDYYDLDKILTNKSGVCVHYAVLTVGMLRSVGVPCRTVTGLGYGNGEWYGHAWVEISPNVTGLNKTALGAGTGTDGWTRLDPTYMANGSDPTNDNNYKTDSFDF